MITVVCGPPCAGKSSYIKDKRKQGELIIDLDSIVAAIGGPAHMSEGKVLEIALCGRRAMIDNILAGKLAAWIIDSKPSDESIRRYRESGAKIIKLDPGKAACVERAKKRPSGTTEAIHRWYESIDSGFIELHKIRPATVTTPTAAERDLRHQSVADNKEVNMKRTDITEIFPEATAEQLDKLMALHGAGVNAVRGEVTTLTEELATARATIETLKGQTEGGSAEELRKATERAEKLQKQLEEMKNAETIRGIREKVAGEKKIPVSLLTGETEELCTQQADAILAFAKPGKYPDVKDGGAAGGNAGGGAWAELASKI